MKKSRIELKLDDVLVNIPYDTVDGNGRIYPKEVMVKAIEKFEQKQKHKQLMEERLNKIKKLKDGNGI